MNALKKTDNKYFFVTKTALNANTIIKEPQRYLVITCNKSSRVEGWSGQIFHTCCLSPSLSLPVYGNQWKVNGGVVSGETEGKGVATWLSVITELARRNNLCLIWRATAVPVWAGSLAGPEPQLFLSPASNTFQFIRHMLVRAEHLKKRNFRPFSTGPASLERWTRSSLGRLQWQLN